MTAKKRDSLKVHEKDSTEQAMDKNSKLLNKIKRLEKELKKLRSEKKTLEVAWRETYNKYSEITKDISLRDILEHIESGSSLVSARGECASCKEKVLKKIDFSSFCILICANCGHREKSQ